MGPKSVPPSVQRLVDELIATPPADEAFAGLTEWLLASRRFREFIESNRDKVRKKIRGATSPNARLDVRAELRAAACILADRRFELAFEAHGAGQRGPDFTATYRTGRPFDVEVTRRTVGTLEPVVMGKLRQFPPSTSNVLVIAVSGSEAAPDPEPALRALRAHAERRHDGVFQASGLDGAAAYHAGLRRLALVITWAEDAVTEPMTAWWSNPDARIPLPEPTRRALIAALAGVP